MQYVPLVLLIVSCVLFLVTMVSTVTTLYIFVSSEKVQGTALLIDESIIKQALELLEQNTLLD